MKKAKSLFTAILSVVCVLCLSAGFISLIGGAPATVGAAITGNPQTQTVDSLEMEGAQVRVAGDKSGLRFVASIDKTECDALMGAYTTVEMGMLVVPKNRLTGELDLDNDDDSIERAYRSASKLVQNGDKYEFRAVLYDIPSSSYGRDVLGRAYLTISDGVNAKTFYADAITRNIAYVSYVATEVLGAESNETYEAYIGDRIFHEISLPSGANCDYLYAYEGQTIEITLDDADSEMLFPNAAATSKSGNVYRVTVGESDMSALYSIDLGSFDTLVANKTFNVGALDGSVTSITSGFTYNAGTGVLTTTNAAGEYDVEITTDADNQYNLKAVVITEVLSSASDLAAFASRSNDGYYVLGGNINASGCEFMNTGATFSGTLDGRGYAIVNGTYISPNDNSVAGGFFGLISAGATIKNVAFTNSALKGEYSWSNCSPFTGSGNIYCNGTIKNVYMEITSIGVKRGDYNGTYVPAKSMGLFGSAGDGSVIDHVIVKSVSGVTYNVCDMVLGNASITDTYVIGGGNANNGWVQTPASSVVSISKVASLSAAQQESFDSSVWSFVNGLPVLKNAYIDQTVDLFLAGADGDMTFSLTGDLGIASGTVAAVEFDGESVSFTQVGANVTVTADAGEYTAMVKVGDKKYFFPAVVITKKLTTVAQLQALMGTYSKDGYYILGGNIDARGQTLLNTSTESFGGTFDGRGYVINGATINSTTDPSRSGLFGGGVAASGVVKNVAFTNAICAYANAGGTLGNDIYGKVDNCLFDFVENPSGNYSKIHAIASSNLGTISNCIIYYNNLNQSGCDGAAISIFNYNSSGATVSNVYVFSGNVAYQNVSNWSNVNANAAYNAALSTVNPQGFNGYWDLTGTKARFNAVTLDVDVDLFLNGADGDMAINLTSELGVASGTVSSVKLDGEAVEFTQDGANVTVSAAAGKHSAYMKVGNKEYFFNVTVVTEKIDNASELSAFASRSNSGYYILGGNIDASALTLMNTDATFSGTFDGRGYAIKGATYSSANGNKPGGLLGTMDYGATVKNLAITGATLTTEGDYNWVYTSVLTGGGRIRGTIKDCYIEITAKGSSTHAMGLGSHGEDVVVDHVILKSVGGLEKNICDMYLGTSSIANTYVIGGSATNTGWNQNSSPVSVANVASLSAAQQASFDSSIWGFTDGLPYFIKAE